MLPRHRRAAASILLGAAILAATLAARALTPTMGSITVAIGVAASAALLLTGFADSRVVDGMTGTRRTAPRVFFRLAMACVLTLLLAIAVSLVVGIVRVLVVRGLAQ